MAAPSFVAATGAHDGLTTNINTFTWTVPATAQAGDVAVVMVGMNASSANPFLTPAGWTAIGTVLNTSANHNTQAFGRVLTSSDPGSTVTATLTSAGAGKIHGGGIIIRGAEGIPSNFTNATDTTTGATVAGPTITTDSADNLIVAVGMLRNTTATTQSTATVSAGWTERTDTGTANAIAPNFTASIATRNAVQTTAGAVTGPTFTSTDTASTGHVWMFAFEPTTAPVSGSAPTYVVAAGAHDSLAANIDTFSWTIPPAAQAGDVAVIAVGLNTGTGVFPAPTGWTAIGPTLVTGANHTTQLFGKKLVAADLGTAVTTTVPVGAGKIHGGGIVVRGAIGVPIEHFATATDTTTGATIAGPTLTTDSANNLVINVAMIRNTTTTTAKATANVSAGYTKRTDTGTANPVAPNFTASFATRDAVAAAPGAVTGATFTSSDTASTGHVWALAFEPVSNVPPTISAGPDQTVEPYSTVTLTFSGSGGDGVIVAYTVTQTDGTPVTRTTPAVHQRQFKAPGTIAGDVLTFSVTATDDTGAMSAPDTVTVTVLPVTERAAVGGAWVPLESRTI